MVKPGMNQVALRPRDARRSRMRRDALAPNSPRERGVGVVMPRAINPDWVSKSKVRQTMWRGMTIHRPASPSQSAVAGHDRKARMTVKEVGIIVHGATGRIGATQHLANALAPICAEGGVVSGADRIMPRLLLVGRNAARLEEIARRCGNAEWTTDVSAALAEPGFSIFFDAAATEQRVPTLANAIAAGKHVYSEKPVALTVPEGLALLHAAKARGLKTGAVEDKIYLPGLQKLSALAAGGFFGRP